MSTTHVTGSPLPVPKPVPTWRGKRPFDLAVALVLTVLTVPLIVVLAVVSAISFRAWPFFIQERVGRNGELFRFVKVRSLPSSSPKYADKYVIQDVHNTRWGVFIRRCHLDEIPQVWLVVIGKMSLVGPRPEMAQLAATFDPEFVTIRNQVRPGMTGLWQVSVAQDGLIGDAPQFDELYVRENSFRLDLWILWRTARDILTSDAAIDLRDVPAIGAARRQPAALGDGGRSSMPSDHVAPALFTFATEAELHGSLASSGLDAYEPAISLRSSEGAEYVWPDNELPSAT